MSATKIPTTNVADVDAAWQEVARYLAARGIHKPADDADPAFWRQVDALQQHDPAFCELMSALAMAVVRSTPSGRDLLAQGARSHFHTV
jgi:hypothetical protein